MKTKLVITIKEFEKEDIPVKLSEPSAKLYLIWRHDSEPCSAMTACTECS